MPIAAILAMITIISAIHLLYALYYKITFKTEKGRIQQEPRSWSSLTKEALVVAAVVLGYAYCVGQIEQGNLEVRRTLTEEEEHVKACTQYDCSET